ncbi:HNH endonuclease [Moraxella osloensis]|uniref:HNH endonuclease domain-containing protein n=1 Tax=Faucicola osloensis TaxID=34062 RepID=UPI0020042D06|nr:HNH endonuclease domain-containing protein [Moraxella osloensis]MCK6157817.1 HNH endonuclease [Moraxella osloensis]MCK6158467.1 HNH endonuclease [Moraxella osloensis]
MNFVDVEPTLENYWRAIILFGKNTASYKFALAKSLIDVSLERKSDLITLDDLALPYALHLAEHLKHSPKQSTAKTSQFIQACQDFNEGKIDEDRLIQITKKEGFKYVLDAFHVVNTKAVTERFYDVINEEFFIDERKFNKGIRLTDNLFKLFYVYDNSAKDLNQETESRWNLVEKAWELNINKNLIAVEFDQETKQLFTQDSKYRRTNITTSRGALNGYQKSRCFYCFKEISISSADDLLADVDHFFPHLLKPDVANAGCCRPVNVDGVWNLVLSCAECNRGESGKFAQVPTIELLERLHTRNEYLIGSHHPLRETLMMQTGTTERDRKYFLDKSYRFSKERLIHNWQPKPQGLSIF